MQDKILLHGLVFHGYHGCLPAEQELGQKFVVDVDLWMDLKRPGNTDAIEATVDYSAVYAEIRKVVERRKFQLLEALATNIAATIFAQFPVDQIRVAVKKPQVAIPGPLDYLGVEIVRQRPT
ncbi:MAG: dihydroneopterin aldolase [Armatimonadetes bacterium]|nr:dihydroneopterin aldolase [Armatimonadota bacterium]PIX38582.1 MAG: dihydroneopterin aldolase [Armatimonadetes bacterium CG_4_8_14_3_um_filter_58_9]PJB74269.1 MAG: dihydroneopterin aldolase [Armatimonadetes bacterium CG_4_9_14_3_um_filter_58_7]